MSIWFKNEVKDSLANRCILMFSGADALSAVAALTSAHLIRFKVISGGVLNHPHLITFLIIISGSLLFLLNIRLFNGYSPHTLMRLKSNYQVVFKSSLLWLIVLPSVTLFIEVLPSVSRGFIMIASFLLFIMVLGGRLVLLIILRKLQVITALRQRILFIDWSPKAEFLAEKIFTDRYHPYEIAGIAPPPGDHFSHPPSMQHPILGSNKEIDQLFKQGLIQIAILADVDRNQKTIASIISLCERHLVTFMMIPLNFQILLTGLQVTTISGIPVLGITALPLEKPLFSSIKRIFDLVGSLIGLVLFAPVILFFCILVVIESPGLPIYAQVRSGKKGKLFRIIKIRSMRLDAEKERGAQWATSQDPRRLRIGAFMRRWNIDELPQFWNVLMGEMSLVGPRPERPELIVSFKETINHYNARHNITPGMTGWAAVNGLRGDTDLQERIRYDLYYMENWSIALDLQIILMTFRNWNSGA